MTQTPSEAYRSRWVEALLPHVAFDGWTDAAAAIAAKEAGLTQGEQALAAPNGVIDLLEHFFATAEAEARANLASEDISALRPSSPRPAKSSRRRGGFPWPSIRS
jgi:ubiquinone biosynthesis protein COQ9